MAEQAAATRSAADGEAGARLEALRASGVDRFDPVRFAYLDALTRRAAGQPPAIRQPLLAKVVREAAALANRHRLAPAPATTGAPAASPLGELLAYIGQQAVAPADARPSVLGSDAPAIPPVKPEPRNATAPELKTVAYFRNTWSRLSTEQQLTQTLAQAPENAGPMNSQHLVLRSLQLMRDLAPDYLQGFMSYVDTLVWLEQASPVRPGGERSPVGDGEKKAKTAKRGAAKR